ncbi:hypothetical protein [Psychrobacillus psychrotolerans]|uniref:hypothetical protein n=1 Tax=Psychrobacillus psychrotolerans TaxID=126156 RepID=UPI003C77715E
MFKKKYKIEVVPESQYTDFSETLEEKKYATNKTLIAAGAVPISVATGLAITRNVNTSEQYSSTVIPVSATVTEPINVLTHLKNP